MSAQGDSASAAEGAGVPGTARALSGETGSRRTAEGSSFPVESPLESTQRATRRRVLVPQPASQAAYQSATEVKAQSAQSFTPVAALAPASTPVVTAAASATARAAISLSVASAAGAAKGV